MALVCHCHAVCDREIVAHLQDGSSTVEELGDQCGAGTRCGGCIPVLEELLDRLASRQQTAA